MSLTRTGRRGFSYLELSIALTIVASLVVCWFEKLTPYAVRARDVRTGVDMEGYRLAATCYAFDHGGRPPADVREIAGYLQHRGYRDPVRWEGSGGAGHFAFDPDRGVRLVDLHGSPAAGVDTRGRRYADYRR